MYTCTHIGIHAHIMYTCTLAWPIYLRTHTQNTCIHAHIYTCTHVYMHTYIQAHIYTCTHLRIEGSKLPSVNSSQIPPLINRGERTLLVTGEHPPGNSGIYQPVRVDIGQSDHIHMSSQSDRRACNGVVPQVRIDTIHQGENGVGTRDNSTDGQTDRGQTDRDRQTIHQGDNERPLSERDTYKTGVDAFARSDILLSRNGIPDTRYGIPDIRNGIPGGTRGEKGFWASINT
jgi:hypothetical protein